MGLISIDYEKVFNQGVEYKRKKEELEKIKTNLKQIESEIKEAWNSEENVVFIGQFEETIKYLDYFTNFLDNKGELLKKMSGIHEEYENEFVKNVERSDLNK